jgi:hypothetical protein
MSLITKNTNLKSLGFGKDRPGGGSSNQPYIKSKPESQTPNEDFILRGGLRAPERAAEDLERMTKMLFDLKSPKGLLFTVKQNLLSRLSVATEASIGPAYGSPSFINTSTNDLLWTKSAVNQGIYNPLSSLLQVSTGYLGNHLNTFGINPYSPLTNVIETNFLPNLGLIRYEDAVKQTTTLTKRIKVQEYKQDPNGRKDSFLGTIPYTIVSSNKRVPIGENGQQNRLIYLYEKHTAIKSENPTLLIEYNGGPGAVMGVGKTQIKFSREQRTGINNFNLTTNPFFLKGGIESSPTSREDDLKTINLLGLSKLSKQSELSEPLEENLTLDKYTGYNEDFQKITIEPEIKSEPIIVDFRGLYPYSDSSKVIEGNDGSRINQRSPGRKDVEGKTLNKYSLSNKPKAVDKINAYPIYESPLRTKTETEDIGNDLVKFRIGVINGNKKEYIHFRAFIDSFSDSYSGKWDPLNYMGRGESFYKYGGFERNISLSFTVAAQSRAELIPQYQKLNFLASTLAPNYGGSDYMGGQLISLTMGGWLYEQIGFISQITLDVPQESPWEIGIDDDGNYSRNEKDEYNKTVKELPHIVKVTGLQFTPIHSFRPEKQKIDFNESGDIESYGEQRFIALDAGREDTNGWSYIPPKP